MNGSVELKSVKSFHEADQERLMQLFPGLTNKGGFAMFQPGDYVLPATAAANVLNALYNFKVRIKVNKTLYMDLSNESYPRIFQIITIPLLRAL